MPFAGFFLLIAFLSQPRSASKTFRRPGGFPPESILTRRFRARLSLGAMKKPTAKGI